MKKLVILKMFKLSALTIILFFGLITSCFANTYYYLGATNGTWNTASNWTSFDGGTHYPGFAAGDVADFSLSSVNVNVTATPPNPIGSIVFGIAGTNSFTISSGVTFTLASALATQQFSTVTITGAGTMKTPGLTFGFDGTVNIGSSSVSTTTVNITSGSFNMAQNGATFTNYGTLNMASGLTFTSGGAAPTTLSNLGTITLPNTTFIYGGNTVTFTNSGSIQATAGTTIKFTGSPQTITNSGSISLDASSLDNQGNQNPIVNSGNITLTNSSTFKISGGSSSPLTNSGNFTATSSAVNFTAGSPNAVINSGNFNCTSSPITYSLGIWTFTNSGNFSAITGSNIVMPGNNSFMSSTAGTFTVTNSNITMAGTTLPAIKNSGTSTCSITNSTVSMGQNGLISQTSTGAFTISGGTVGLGPSAAITNSSTGAAAFTIKGSAIVNFAANSHITNTGTFYAGISGSACTLNLTAANTATSAFINNSTATGLFNLASTSIIYLDGSLTNITNTSPGVFTLQSDPNGSAAIGALASNATCTGTFNVERYYQGGSTKSGGRYIYRNYRIISSPVHNTAQFNSNNVYGLNYIVGGTANSISLTSVTNAYVTGCTGGNTSAGNPSLYLYRESIVPNSSGFTSGNFIGITNITNSSGTGVISTSDGSITSSIPVGNGVLFFDRGAATNWATRTQAPYITPDPVTLTSIGLLNTQAITVKDWYSPSLSTLGCTTTGVGTGSNTNTKVRGFNMVGNPYACAIDWNTAYAPTAGNGITRTNVNPTIWVFNPVTNQYDSYITTSSSTGTSNPTPNNNTDGTGNATNIIASGQGFFVQATSSSASSLVFNETAKLATGQVTGNNLLMGTPVAQTVAQRLRLKMVTDSINYDDIVIGFRSTASPKFDGMEDARYIPGNAAAEGLSSVSDDSVKLSINYLPLPKLAPQSIKLFVTAAKSGQYTMQKAALDGLPQIYEVWLMDKYKKDSLDIRNNSTYIFNIDLTDTMSYGSNRFEVLIRQNPALGVHLLQFTAAKATGGSKVTWKTENEVNYTNFTVQRSNDNGVTFNVVGGFVSSALGTYSFLDSTPAIGANQYRLKLEDLNGAITYSKVVTLQYANGTNDITINNITVYPNPASSTINLAIAPVGSQPTNSLSALQSLGTTPALNTTPKGSISYAIKIMSVTGSVVKNSTSATASWQDNVSNLSPGTYIIQVTDNKDKSVVGKGKFVKQ